MLQWEMKGRREKRLLSGSDDHEYPKLSLFNFERKNHDSNDAKSQAEQILGSRHMRITQVS